MSKSHIIIAILSLLSIGLSLALIFKTPPTIINTVPIFEDGALKDSLKAVKKERDMLRLKVLSNYRIIDSLEEVKEKIIIKYEKPKKIIPNATNEQLDSLIRSII